MTKEVKTQSLVSVVRNNVAKMIEHKAIVVPKDYSPENAVTLAWMIIKDTKAGKAAGYKPALEVCTPDSIKEAMFKMVAEGLSPLRNQCYFIIRGDKLCYHRAASGSEALAKRYSGIKRVDVQLIYEGEEPVFEIKNGIMTVLEHKRGDRTGKAIKGGYAVVTEEDGTEVAIDMTIDEIKQAWEQGEVYGKFETSAHTKFEGEMAKKTIKQRACKPYITGADDSRIIEDDDSRYVPGSGDEEEVQYAEAMEIKAEEVKEEIEEVKEEPRQVKSKKTVEPKKGNDRPF